MEDKIKTVIELLQELRQDFCDIESKQGGKSILAIDRIDTLLDELNFYIN